MTAAKASKFVGTVGKRKTSIARIQLRPGNGQLAVNGRVFQNYFGREALRYVAMQPFQVTSTEGQYDVRASIYGGGPAGQADAFKYAVAKALLQSNPNFKKPLRIAGLLTRDSRIVERKKYGRRGARRRPQYSKR